MRIFINPGHHPGIDPGAVNEELGINEADIVLEIGQYLEEILGKAGHEIYLLQSNNLNGEDWHNPNVCRTANNWNAALFVSIHCNAHNDPKAHGTECFVYRHYSRADEVATFIQSNLVKTLNTTDRGVKVNSFLSVLQNTTMPAVLVETAFISNEEDADLLINRKKDIAQAIAKGIMEWVKHNER